MRLILIPTLATVALLGLTACAGPLKQWGEEISLVSRAASFDPAALEREHVAVMNAVVSFGLEGFNVQVSRSLSLVLEQAHRPIKAISVQDALSRINQAGLAAEYSAMMADYLHSGILNRDVLAKVGKVLNAAYVIQPSMASFTQATAGRFSFFGLRLFQTRVTTLRLSAQFWDTRSGEIVWGATGEATLAVEDVREFRIPFEDIARRLWERILQNLDL